MIRKQPGFTMAVNFLILMVIYMLSRWVFYYMNIGSFHDVSINEMMIISMGGLRFDLSALCYMNALCILLQFIPWKKRHTIIYQQVVKWLFIIINALGIAVNAADMVYFEFGGRRTTATIFSEFGGESNLGTIFLNSITGHWQVWLFGIVMIAALILLYYNPLKNDRPKDDFPANKVYYTWHTAVFAMALLLTVAGARGGLAWKMHPLRQDSAELYCEKPLHTAIVLNTPFTLITTAHKSGYKDPHFFAKEELDNIFNPYRNLQPTGGEMKKLNVVVFILESFSMEYTGYFNKDKDGGNYQGYTPFLDS
ncbi:MAG: hypothetical protein K5856_09165, partial [Bacteroidaceae bacterium]|nr:hypothetical protein [Bacteroidaceae bacterium]